MDPLCQLCRCFSVEYETGKMFRLVCENVRLRAYPSVKLLWEICGLKSGTRLLTRFPVLTGLSITVSVQFLQKCKFSSTVGLMCVSVTNENVITQQLYVT
jgi:hypothetical protein